jgi:hypothetical protein
VAASWRSTSTRSCCGLRARKLCRRATTGDDLAWSQDHLASFCARSHRLAQGTCFWWHLPSAPRSRLGGIPTSAALRIWRIGMMSWRQEFPNPQTLANTLWTHSRVPSRRTRRKLRDPGRDLRDSSQPGCDCRPALRPHRTPLSARFKRRGLCCVGPERHFRFLNTTATPSGTTFHTLITFKSEVDGRQPPKGESPEFVLQNSNGTNCSTRTEASATSAFALTT